MEYILAKQLKDAGFPQPDFHLRTEDMEDIAIQDPEDSSVWYYQPTLEELMEAVWDKTLFKLECSYGSWYATDNSLIIVECRKVNKTPVEAVAKLYITLHGS